MSGSEPDLPIDMGAVTVLRRALSIVGGTLRVPLVVLLGSVGLLVPFVGPLVLIGCVGLAFEFADESLGYTPPSVLFVRRFVNAILAAVLATLAVAIGLVCFVLPGIYLGIKFMLVLPAAWIGDAGPLGALADSWDLATGNQRTTIVVGFLFGGLALAVGLVGFDIVVPTLSTHLAENGIAIPGSYPRLRLTIAFVAAIVGVLATATWTVMYRGFPYP